MRSFKSIIFDLDGTLADTQQDLADSMNRVLANHDFPQYNYEAYKYLVGKGLRNLVIKAIPDGASKSMVDICLNELISDYRKNCLNKTKLYPGIFSMLKEIEAMSIPMAVFTNKDHELAVIVCNALLQDVRIEFVLGRMDERPRKPDPAGALFLADKLSVTPNHILYAGDTDNDMQCAKAAGMTAVGVLWGFRDRKELEANGADFIAEQPSDIIRILSNK
jgi:phosphoglycolate phosphatase